MNSHTLLRDHRSEFATRAAPAVVGLPSRLSPEPVAAPCHRFLRKAHGAPVDCLLRIPTNAGHPSRLLIAVHGIGRDAVEQIEGWGSWADRNGFTLLAPVFREDEFPGYQRLEPGPCGRRADQALLQLLSWLPSQGHALPARRVLFGHSGGAQFAHRFLLLQPFAVDAAILSSAGWYTWPDDRARFPYGTGRPRNDTSRPVEIEALLKVPMLITVGELDDTPDAAMRRRPSLDERQGVSRLDRAGRWVAALRREALLRQIPGRIEGCVLPGATHAFASCIQAGLPDRAARFLGRLPWLWRQPGPQA